MKMKIMLLVFMLTLFVTPALIAQDTTGLAISPQKFRKQLKKKNSVILDVRTPEEYKAGFIGRATNYNVLDSLAFLNSIAPLDRQKSYLLYCKSGRRSGKALVMMKNIGFRNVHHLKGGVTEWIGGLKKPG